jgi:hypothetical protein
MSKENLVKAPKERVKRTGLGTRNRLVVKNRDPNYEYRFVNDTEDRINEFVERGWVPEVAENVIVGGERLEEAKGLGSVKSIAVGGGKRAVLLKIPKEFYLEDQASKEDYNRKTEEAMRSNPNDGTYGKVDLSRR